MAIHPDVRDHAYHLFIQEAPELLQVIETELLQLRLERTRGRVHALMRAAHSIKGGAGNVGLEAIHTLAHRLEECFRALYHEELQIDVELEHTLLQGFDCLKLPLLDAIQQGESFQGHGALQAADPVFERLEAQLGSFLGGEDQLPTVAEMGIDITQNIFELDVAGALDRLEGLSLDLQHSILAGELRAQAEVFNGIGELLNLSGFQQIAQLTLQILDRDPHQASTLLPIALADFRQAQQDILAGDRVQGGHPSTALLAMASPDQEHPAEMVGSEFETWLDDLNTFEESSGFTSELSPDWDLGESFAPDQNLEPNLFGEESDEADGSMLSPDLEDIFGDLESERTETLSHNSMPDLEDIFGDLESELAEPISDAETVEYPALEDVFSDVPEREIQGMKPSESQGVEPVAESNILSSFTSDQNSVLARPASSPVLTLRIELSRLERMNNQLGELSINHNSLSLHNDQLRNRLRELFNRFDQFRGLGLQLRSLLDKMLISPERNSRSQAIRMAHLEPGLKHLGSALEATLNQVIWEDRSQFDSLELDIYSDLYTLLQTAVDSIQQLEEAVEDVKLFADRSHQDLDKHRQLMAQLREELMGSRMLPIGDIFSRFPRLLRDLAYEYKKPVELNLVGTTILVDRVILEKLTDPLIHLLRNAFDHGIEDPETRRQLNKPEQGQIWVRAYYRGNRTVIEVEDDGKGIDSQRILDRAQHLGLLSSQEALTLSQLQIFDLVFTPGFSTTIQANKLSGRGVGLDIVRSQVRALKGNITLTSEPQQGTRFTLEIPLTLSVAKLLVVWTGSSTVALPSDGLEEIVIPQSKHLKQIEDRSYLYWQGQWVPLHDLKDLLPYTQASASLLPNPALGSVPSPAHWANPVLILQQGDRALGLRIERMITEQELVIKPISSALPAPEYLFGCTIMGDGSLIPVIDGFSVLDQRQKRSWDGATTGPSPTSSSVPTILIVDDSANMRQTLTSTLEKAGYQVLRSKDGQEALRQLRTTTVQLMICDIEMPVMNGFELLTHLRQDPDLGALPVVMLTSRSSHKHRQLCLHLGAKDYFTKPYVEQDLMGRLAELLAQSI